MITIASLSQNKATVRRLYDICLNERNLDEAVNLVSADFTSADGVGVAGFQETARKLQAAFDPLTYTIVTMLAEGTQVAVRWKMEGVHVGEWMGVAPTGKAIEIYANVLYEMEGGKVLQAWPQVDSLALLRQLGVLEAMPTRRQPNGGGAR